MQATLKQPSGKWAQKKNWPGSMKRAAIEKGQKFVCGAHRVDFQLT